MKQQELQVIYTAAQNTGQLIIDEEIAKAIFRGDFRTKTVETISAEIYGKLRVQLSEILSEVYGLDI